MKAIAAIALQAFNGQYLRAEDGGGGPVVADRDRATIWETLTSIVEVRSSKKLIMMAENNFSICEL